MKGYVTESGYMGYVDGSYRLFASEQDYLEQLERVFGDMDVPVIWNADIGHTRPSFTLINGSVGHLTFDCGSAALSMELK